MTTDQIAATTARLKQIQAHATNALEIKPDGIYTLQQIQEAASVSRPTLYRWRNGGGLRVIRVANVVRVRGKDFLEFLERYTTKVSGDSGGGEK